MYILDRTFNSSGMLPIVLLLAYPEVNQNCRINSIDLHKINILSIYKTLHHITEEILP